MKPVEIEYLIKNGTRATLEKISADLLKVGSDGSQSGDAISAALVRSQVQATLLRDVIANLTAQANELRNATPELDQTKNIAEAEKLESKIEKLKIALKQLEEQGENTQVLPQSFPNAKRQFDGLHFSIQQMAREMPSLAMGPQMFFLAISNNLPIFTDELARAKKEYAELIATGQKGTPVWKQVAKSLFSWQTLLTTGIMLLVMHGDKIVSWGKSLFSAKKTLADTIETLDEFQKRIGEFSSDSITALEILSTKWVSLGGDVKSQEQFLIDNADAIKKIGVSINNAAEAESIFVLNKDVFIKSLLERAKAAAAMELAAEEYKKSVAKMVEADAMPDQKQYTHYVGKMFQGEWVTSSYDNPEKEEAQKQADLYFKNGTELLQKYAEFSEKERQVLSDLGIQSVEKMVDGSVRAIEATIAIRREALKDLTDPAAYKQQLSEIEALEARVRAITGAQDPNDLGNSSIQNTIDFEKELLTMRYQNQQAEIDLMADGSDKKIAQIKLNYTKEIAEIKDQETRWKEAQDGVLTSGQSDEIVRAKQVAAKALEKELLSVAEYETKLQQDKNDKLLREYETYEQARERLKEEYESKISAMYVDAEQTTLKVGFEQGNIDKLTADYHNAMAKINIDTAKTTGVLGDLFGDWGYKSVEAIDEIVIKAEEMYSFLESASYDATLGEKFGITEEQFDTLVNNVEAMAAFRKQLELLKNQSCDTGTGLQKLLIGLQNIKEGLANNNSELFTQGIREVSSETNECITLFNSFADALENIGELSENDSFKNIANGISDVTSVLGETLSMAGTGAAVGGPIGAIVGGAIGLVSSVTSIFVENAQAQEAYIKAIEDGIYAQQQAYLQAQRELAIQAADVSTMFGDNMFGSMSNYWQIYKTELSSLKENVQKLNDITLDFQTHESGWFSHGAIYWSETKKWTEELTKKYPALTEGAWGFNKELAESLLNLENMSEKEKDILREAIETYDAATEALATLDGQIESVFGDLSTSLGDVIWDSVANGTDAWTGFQEVGAEAIAALGKQMLSEFILTNYLEGYKDQMREAFVSGNPAEAAAGVVDDIISGLDSVLETGAAVAKGYQEWMTENGYKITDAIEDSSDNLDDDLAAYRESLTDISFDSLRDNFKSTLLDMTSDSEDFMENLDQMIQGALVETMMTTKYDQLLSDWYTSFADSMEDDRISDAEREQLQHDYEALIKSATSEREKLIELFGWSLDDTTNDNDLEEDIEDYREALADISFDSLRDKFKNTLLDMTSSSEDFANNLESMMQNALVESLMTSKYEKALDEWYTSFADSISDGNMSESERSNLKESYEEIVNSAITERGELIEMFGWPLEEVVEDYREALTNVSFDSLRNDFKSVLLDMTSDAEAFASNIDDMMLDAVVESLMKTKYDQILNEWYTSFADSMTDDGINEAEAEWLRKEYEDIINDALAEREAILGVLGISPTPSTTTQTGSAGAFEALSQDQGTKLEGLFTANEMRTARIEEGVESVAKQMNTAVGHLAKIETNTGKCSVTLEEIMRSVKEIIRDGLKMK